MRLFPALIVVVSALVAVPAAQAQYRSERPYRGLFAGGVGESEQLLAANASLGTGWDTNLAADAAGRNVFASDVNRDFRGGVSTGSAALSYSLNRAAVQMGATAGTTGRYYPSIDDNSFVRRDYGSIGGSAILGAGFSAQGSAAYQPYNLRSMMPTFFEPRIGDPLIVDEDFPSSLEHYFGYTAGAGYSRALTRRQTFNANYDFRARDRAGAVETFKSHGASADLTYLLGRDLSLRLGYGYTEALYGNRNFANHIIDIGVNYDRALSFSRRTTLSFGTGSSAMRRFRNESLRFRVNGSARLNHEIGRTWLANLTYNRGLQFVETWPEPVYSDSAVAGVGGLLNRRVQVQFAAQWLRGRSYFEADRDRLEGYGGNASVSYAISRHINSGLVYTYYHHKLGNLISPIPGFPGELERQSARVFISLWVPLFERAGRP